jgi:maleylacetate reductase
MQSGTMVFTAMNRVIFGKPAVDAIVAEADRLGAKRVFVLSGATLNRQTDEIAKVRAGLGDRFAGVFDHMPAHSPRNAVVACANAAREAGCDLLVTFGGGSVTDGGKAVTICLEHDIRDFDGMEPFRSVVKDGKRHVPDFRAPNVRQIAVPTTLSAGEFNARAGVTDTRLKLKQSFMHRSIVPETVILDPAVTVHTPEWLWLSSGVRAVDHAVETFLSLDANDYTDGTALQALRSLGDGLVRVKADPGDLDARLRCMMGAWLSMVGIVTGTRLGASHAIGHIRRLGGRAARAYVLRDAALRARLQHVGQWRAPARGLDGDGTSRDCRVRGAGSLHREARHAAAAQRGGRGGDRPAASSQKTSCWTTGPIRIRGKSINPSKLWRSLNPRSEHFVEFIIVRIEIRSRSATLDCEGVDNFFRYNSMYCNALRKNYPPSTCVALSYRAR